MAVLQEQAFDLIFNQAKTYYDWNDTPVSDNLLKEIYNLLKMGPTSFNCSPARIIYIKSKEEKERLSKHLMEANIEKVAKAPVTAIIAYDAEFYEKLPKLFPFMDARSIFADNKDLSETTAFRNSTLQGAYFMIAARMLGLDCGPMSGFNNISLDKDYFPDGKFKSNFLCNIGYGIEKDGYQRAPRLEFDDACEIR